MGACYSHTLHSADVGWQNNQTLVVVSKSLKRKLSRKLSRKSPKASLEPEKPFKNTSSEELDDCEKIDCTQAPPNAVTNPDTDLILNMLDPENGPASGLPYQVHYLGPPRPPCEKERLATVMALNKINDNVEPDPEISTILKLVQSVFKCPAALCALFDEQRVFISEQEGNVIPCGAFPWRWTLCGWSMAFKNPQVLVIQDTLQDARFSNNEKVTVFPKVRFYCGAPLVASNGHRLGTLCFADVKPRKFDMASCVMMNNLSELVVRQLEKDIALKMKERDNKLLLQTYKHLQRAVDAYEHCVVLLDTTEDGFRVVYANGSWTKLTGLSRDTLVGKSLRDVLECTDGTQLPSDALIKAVKSLKNLSVKMARVKDPQATKTFSLSFKPAGRQMIDNNTVPIGIPNFLQPTGGEDEVAHKFYFMTMYPPDQKRSSVVTGSSILAPSGVDFSCADSSETQVIPGLELAHLLGRGSWGWVYYGTWYNTPVAVKIIDDDHTPIKTETEGLAGAAAGPNKEALMAHELRHPYIVATLTYSTRMVPCGRAPEYIDYQASNMHTLELDTCMNSQSAIAVAEEPHGSNNKAWAVIEAPPAGPVVEEEFADVVDTDALALKACQVKADGWQSLEYNAGMLGTKEMEARASVPRSERTSLDAGVLDTETPSTSSNTMQQTWMVMEFCDRGCVQEAIDRGWLRTERDCLTSKANMSAVLATSIEIASAMSYLHAHDIVHGDLTGWNVMLSSVGASSNNGGRGFVAKVADFGMSRNMATRARFQTKNYGTITHMPPELLTSGVMSKKVDVWSFGVLLWQMYTGSRPWSGLTHAQVIIKVAREKQSLQWDADTPEDFLTLAQSCMAFDADNRPSFPEIVKTLETIRSRYDEV